MDIAIGAEGGGIRTGAASGAGVSADLDVGEVWRAALRDRGSSPVMLVRRSVEELAK